MNELHVNFFFSFLKRERSGSLGPAVELDAG